MILGLKNWSKKSNQEIRQKWVRKTKPSQIQNFLALSGYQDFKTPTQAMKSINFGTAVLQKEQFTWLKPYWN